MEQCENGCILGVGQRGSIEIDGIKEAGEIVLQVRPEGLIELDGKTVDARRLIVVDGRDGCRYLSGRNRSVKHEGGGRG